MAPDRNRVGKAFDAMRSLGIDVGTAKPVLKRLLKLYNGNWELIEEDNYRTFIEAIFEDEDDKLKAEKNEDMINEDVEPPLKKPHRGNPEDKVLSNGDKGKGIADIHEGGVPKSSCRFRMAKPPQSDSGDPTNEPYNCVSESSREMQLDHENRNAMMPREKQPIDHSPRFASPTSHICLGSTNTSQHLRSSSDSIRKDHPEADIGKRISSGSRSSISGSQAIAVANNDKKRVFLKVNDITKGNERVKISLLDEVGNEDLPRFVYCPENITYESAHVHVSLARIADEDCCSDCIGDCLSSSIPCACARNTGGEFAYTPEGLLNEEFLKSCISMKVEPDETKHLFYCQDCPSQRAKNPNMPEKCKGHILRKFIKECWRKCGCNVQCGNRVVQRGITRKLQVFLTSDGKGWGLRTLEELPQGAFVCEYVGEILTNIELYVRNNRRRGEDKHVYPVLLDADWATEESLKDEDALCLDATQYGNVARFINHRCYDGNLIEIPVQVETPDRHYYHLAFFTARKVAALEELTWDYDIDFDDHKHPIKAFQCRCGSKYCRHKKAKKRQSARSRMAASSSS